MAKASDNVFPKVIYGMQTTNQAAPTDSSWKMYSKADGIYARSSNAIVGPLAAAGGVSADLLQWHIFLPGAASTPDATTGTWAQSNPGDVSSIYSGMIANASSNAQNDAIAWDIVLAAGTWDVHHWVRRSTNTAILTLSFDGVSKGTVDTYNGLADYFKASITGISVPTTAKIRVQAKAATRNGSNTTGWVLGIFAVEFRRTA